MAVKASNNVMAQAATEREAKQQTQNGAVKGDVVVGDALLDGTLVTVTVQEEAEVDAAAATTPSAEVGLVALRPSPASMAKSAGLRYVSDSQPGYTRRRCGRGFRYFDWKNEPLRDADVRAWIDSLVIPPAWQEVWICRNRKGHLLVTGRDAAGRKQYIYHPEWARVRDQVKYSKLLTFGEALSDVRQQIAADLRKRTLGREKVTALVLALMDQTLIRIGNDEYARQNSTYGLTTMQDEHVHVENATVVFEFRGKSGKEHEIALRDRRLAQLVKTCQELPGQRLFQYIDSDGNQCALTSTEVNEYLRTATGYDFTAKDFRTWGGTVEMARLLHEIGPYRTQTELKKNVTAAIKQVAEALGNTPAVCRAHYVHPAILDAYEQHKLDGYYQEAAELAGPRDNLNEIAVHTILQHSVE